MKTRIAVFFGCLLSASLLFSQPCFAELTVKTDPNTGNMVVALTPTSLGNGLKIAAIFDEASSADEVYIGMLSPNRKAFKADPLLVLLANGNRYTFSNPGYSDKKENGMLAFTLRKSELIEIACASKIEGRVAGIPFGVSSNVLALLKDFADKSQSKDPVKYSLDIDADVNSSVNYTTLSEIRNAGPESFSKIAVLPIQRSGLYSGETVITTKGSSTLMTLRYLPFQRKLAQSLQSDEGDAYSKVKVKILGRFDERNYCFQLLQVLE